VVGIFGKFLDLSIVSEIGKTKTINGVGILILGVISSINRNN
jgi:hypothetical protein